MKTKEAKGIVGVSGEYFVAAELSQRGVIATLTLKNTPRIDILATNLKTGKVANIQVKTMSIDNNAGWHLGMKDTLKSEIKNHFYVLVNLKGPWILPEYIIIPQAELGEFLDKRHKNWLSKTRRDWNPHKDTTMRIFDPNRSQECRDFAEKYKDNWGILGLF